MPVPKRAVAGKLPGEITSFVGRRRMLGDLKVAFASTRLLTLVGPGGVGKTRLALRAAGDLQRSMRDGAWFIDLAGLDDPHLVAKTFMTSLGLVDQSGQWPTSLLVAHLASREALVVIDNCEHLLDAVAVLADVILKEASAVRLLATSRQALGISGEHVVQVPSLTLASRADAGLGQGLAHSEAAALFLERVADAGVALELTDDTNRLIVDLCSRLDGVPLALELAAVRLRTIGLDELVDRLSDRFAVLTGGSRAALPRQQTLRATIDWSHDLLTVQEKSLLRRLAVFPSEFGLDAAEAVGAGNDVIKNAVLEALAGLVEKSFVTRVGVAGGARYRLHETMREYSLLKLRDSGEEEAAIRAFVGFYADLCKEAGQAAQTPGIVRWLKWLEDEADNVRAVLAHCLNGFDLDVGMATVGTLGWYWAPRATSEGMYWLDLYLEHRGADSPSLARALFARGFVATVQGDGAAALRLLDDAEASARATNDMALVLRVLSLAARVRALGGDLDGARSQVAEAHALAQVVNDPGAAATVTQTQGFIALATGDFHAASRVYVESLPVIRTSGDLHSLIYNLGYYGFSLLQDSRPEEAGPPLEEGLLIAQELDNRDVILYHLFGLACREAMLGRHRRAARLLGATATVQAEMGAQLIPMIEHLLRETTASLSTSLGRPAFESEMSEGRQMSREQAIAYALHANAPGDRAPVTRPATSPLSKREIEIARFVAEGLSNKEIASRCFLSDRTVETHVSNILNKLGINSRVEVASWVAQESRLA
jgi:predicted ATPase/DNA-binding CsgD family transcriptional regulator